MNNYNDSARRVYQRRLAQRQIVLFGTIGVVLAALLLINTIFWTGIVPFPFNKEFATKKLPEKISLLNGNGTIPVQKIVFIKSSAASTTPIVPKSTI